MIWRVSGCWSRSNSPIFTLVLVREIAALAAIAVVTVAQVIQADAVGALVLFRMTLVAIAALQFGRQLVLFDGPDQIG